MRNLARDTQRLVRASDVALGPHGLNAAGFGPRRSAELWQRHMSRPSDVPAEGLRFGLSMLLLTVTCMAILSTGARVTPTGFILRRTPLQILRESETQGATDFAPGTSGGAPTYWLYHDFHREVPAQVEATGWILAGNAADAAERAAAHHERWKETGKPEATDAVSIPNWGRAEILENIARLLTDAYALQY